MRINISLRNIDSEEFLKNVTEKYHFLEKDWALLGMVYNEILACARAQAVYRINQWNTGIKDIDTSQTALVAMTLGAGLDELQENYQRSGNLQESYMVECMASELLLYMYESFNKDYARFHRRYVKRYVFIGDDIPVSDMSVILGHLYEKGDVEQEIYANEYGALIPSKSVVLYALLTDNPNQVCQGICVGCNRTDCENSQYKKSEPRREVAFNYGMQRIFGV